MSNKSQAAKKRIPPERRVAIESLIEKINQAPSQHPGGWKDIMDGLVSAGDFETHDALMHRLDEQITNQISIRGVIIAALVSVLDLAGYPTPSDEDWDLAFAFWQRHHFKRGRTVEILPDGSALPIIPPKKSRKKK